MRSKIKYQKIDDDHDVQCMNCDRILPKKYFGIRNLYEDGNRGICSYCDWIRRHQDVFPIIDGWTKEQILQVVQFQLIGEDECVNDLQKLIP